MAFCMFPDIFGVKNKKGESHASSFNWSIKARNPPNPESSAPTPAVRNCPVLILLGYMNTDTKQQLGPKPNIHKIKYILLQYSGRTYSALFDDFTYVFEVFFRVYHCIL